MEVEETIDGLDEMFMDADEKEAAVLGKGQLHRFLEEGILKSGFCILTDRRVYFRGRYLQKTGSAYQASRGEYTIDLKDVTGSGFSTARFGVVFLLGILYVLVMTVLAGFFLFFLGEAQQYRFDMPSVFWSCKILLGLGLVAVPVCYYLKPFRVFVIEYSGGEIAFLVYDYLEDDMRLFQKALYRAKDAYMSDSLHREAKIPAGRFRRQALKKFRKNRK